MQAIAYIRVSTEQQSQEGISLEAQEARIRAWCLANDVKLEGVFIDAGVSGKRADNRPQLQLALDAVCKCRGVLVVYSLSRLTRSTKDTITLSERLEKNGADLVSLTEKIDTTSAAGKMVFRMLAVLNEFERDQVSERTTAAMAHKRSKRERVGTVPFGFDLAGDGVSLVENEAEQRIIKIIDELHAQGESLRTIARRLTEMQAPTKNGTAAWSHTTIQRIVSRAA